jgi:hypothetical protein
MKYLKNRLNLTHKVVLKKINVIYHSNKKINKNENVCMWFFV